jgi:hypothetical protein
MKKTAATSDYRGGFGDPREWNPITPEMAWRFFEESTPSHVSDPVSPIKDLGYTECRLIAKGDPYTAAVWELR